MSIIIRVCLVAACAYAGLVVADIQFKDVPDTHQIVQR